MAICFQGRHHTLETKGGCDDWRVGGSPVCPGLKMCWSTQRPEVDGDDGGTAYHYGQQSMVYS